ncbi:MAG: ABC transporter permease [Verrucomicrobia bacterium]|nr:ABC transporter permease [Verrucomicrobiota bacterium]
MNWLALSLKEWHRRPLRTGVTTAGVAIAVAALFSALAFLRGYREGVGREVQRLGAHVLVAPKGCPYDAASIALHGASWSCYLKSSYLEEVRATPGVALAAPAFMAALHDSTATQSVYVGVETNYLALKPGWKFEGLFPREKNELLAGAEVARRLGWRVGQQVRLPGCGEALGTVSGILAATQAPEATFIFLRLEDAQQLFRHPAELTHVLVRLQDPNQMDTVVTQLRGCDAGLYMNVIPLAHLLRTMQTLVNSTRVLVGCVALVAWLAAGAGVSNTLLMAVAERGREIGVMRALGAARGDIFRLFWMETLQVCLVGAVAGVLLAFAAARNVETWLRGRLPFAPADALVQWDWSLAATCLGCALVLGSVAGFLPAWRAAHLSPTEAIRCHARLV